MTLTVRDAAKLLDVSQKTIYRWISDRQLPARRIGDQYRLSRSELLDWVSSNRVDASLELFTHPDEESGRLPTLEGALASGGILYRVEGTTRDEVLRSAVAAPHLPEGVNGDFVYEMLRSREQLASTAVGGGIALPHPRHPLVLHVAEPTITLCFLEEPVDFGAPDGQPVHALFLLLSPNVKAHLHLLGLVAFGLRQASFAEALNQQAARNVILEQAAKVDALTSTPPESVEPSESEKS